MTPQNISPNNDSRFINQVCSNTKSDLIEITEDKLENILMKYLFIYKKIKSWVTPLSIFLTIFTTLLTTNFNKDFLSIPKEVWCAMFYICLLFSFFWLIYQITYIVINKKKVKIEILIKSIKNN